MKFKHVIAATIFATSLAVSFGVASKVENPVIEEAEAADYYASITDSMSGSTLQSALKSIINTNSVSVSYDWSRYEAADEDPNNSNNVILVYARTSVAKSAHVSGNTGWNREHTFPASKLSNSQAEKDNHIIFASDNKVNGARSNIKMGVVTGGTVVNDYNGNATTCRKTSSLFDPNNVARGIVARSTMYAAAMYDYDPEDNFESIATMLRWHLEYQPTSQDITRNNTVYSNQKNRNPFVDHPEYACRIWGNTNSTTQSICAAASTGVTISSTAETINVGGTVQISATSSDSSTIAWTSSNTSVATVSSASASSGSNITITGVTSGSATITARATINSTQYTATCAVTVTNSTPTKLSTPQPSYDSSTKRVSWDPISNASSYQVKVDNGSYAAATSPYNASGLTPEVQHTVYVKAIGDGSSYSDSDAGQVQFTPTSGGGQAGEEITLEVDFSGSKSSDTDSEGNVWTTTGSYTTGANYLRLNSSDTYFSNDPALMVDTGETMSVTASLRTYGGVNSQSLRVTAYNDSDTAISNTLVLSPTDSTLRTYSGTLTFTNSIDHEVTIKAYSGNNNSLGISGISFTYTSWAESSKTLTGISVQTSPETSYESGETFDPAGLVIVRTYSDDSSDTYTYSGHTSEFTFDPSLLTPLTVDDDVVEITYGGQSCFLPIDVIVPKVLSSISLSGYTTAFVEGDTFSYGGTVTAHYADTSSEDVTSSATFSGYNMTTTGNQTITVSYGGKSQTYQITVSQGTLSSIAVSGQTTEYVKNASFSFDGTCTATFANGYQKVVAPTSVTSPDMSTTGNKAITVSYTYNGNTRTTSYQISVSSYRTVMEETYSVIGTITYTNDTEEISVASLSTAAGGSYSQIDTQYHAWRLGAGSKTGNLTVNSASSNIYKITVNAKYYSSDNSAFTIDGTSKTLTNAYADYTKEFDSAKNSVVIASVTNGRRVLIASITVYTKTNQDIGQSEDCVGLENFINTYMHMDYTENLGYCSDSTHHYYSTAKTAFNALNPHQRSIFTGNSAYSAEWTRLSTWASKNGDSLNSSNILALGVKSPLFTNISSNSGTLIIVIAVLSLTGLAIGGYFLLRKKRKKIKNPFATDL